MNFSICRLELHEIERLQCDSISIYIFEDVVPLRGIAGIMDWRLNGTISGLLIDGTLKGKKRENFLMPLRPRMGAKKLFGFGLGKASEFSLGSVEGVLHDTFTVLNKAAVHSTALMLPGRCGNLYPLEEGLPPLGTILKRDYDLDELVITDRFENPEKELEAVRKGAGLAT